jgi:hypothetical protein
MTSDASAPVGIGGLLGADDLVDALGGPDDLARLVHHDVVVVLLPGQLEDGVALAHVELVGRLRCARLKPREEILVGGCHEEDEEGLGNLLLDLGRALDVDLEDGVASSHERRSDLVARRAVPVVVHEVRLEEPADLALCLEFLRGEEVVVDAIDLVRPARSRGAGRDEVPLRVGRDEAQRLDDRVLPDA